MTPEEILEKSAHIPAVGPHGDGQGAHAVKPMAWVQASGFICQLGQSIEWIGDPLMLARHDGSVEASWWFDSPYGAWNALVVFDGTGECKCVLSSPDCVTVPTPKVDLAAAVLTHWMSQGPHGSAA